MAECFLLIQRKECQISLKEMQKLRLDAEDWILDIGYLILVVLGMLFISGELFRN
jgi:hypothetical protein